MFNSLRREIVSPDGRTKCVVALLHGEATYLIYRDEKLVLSPSRLGFSIYGEPDLKTHLKIKSFTTSRRAETVELPWGEDHFIDNAYAEATFVFLETKPPRREFSVAFRVFNDAIAFRYHLPARDKIKRLTIADELTEFNLDLKSTIWSIPAYQPDRYEYNYEKSALSTLNRPAHTPFTAKTPSKVYLSLHEAALYDYGAMNLELKNGILKSDITPLSNGARAHIDLPFNTPWRLIMLADSAIELTKNRTMYALNDPPAGDFSWVKPLKFIGIWWAMYVGEWTWAPGEKHGATTAHARSYIDAAVRLEISGLLIEGWNEGWEGDWLENGLNNSFLKSTPDFDLPAVARYAQEKHVEFVGHHETVGFVDNYEKQLAAAYNFYAANGIHYLKTGYAGSKMWIHGREEWHHSQLGVIHYQKTVELAAKKHLCLDIHEPIKGTGLERTWPNLLTREGARGQEYEGGALKPSHACLLPYTRLLAGGMDYTCGILDLQNPAKPVHTTLARQLAYFITIYSGMTMVADRPQLYEDHFPELFPFIRDVPVSFEQTLPLSGEIGEYYIVARKDRASLDWYVGGVTNESAREVRINLDFLDEDRPYVAEIYADARDAHYLENPFAIEIAKKHVNRSSALGLHLASGGGFAIKIRPV